MAPRGRVRHWYRKALEPMAMKWVVPAEEGDDLRGEEKANDRRGGQDDGAGLNGEPYGLLEPVQTVRPVVL